MFIRQSWLGGLALRRPPQTISANKEPSLSKHLPKWRFTLISRKSYRAAFSLVVDESRREVARVKEEQYERRVSRDMRMGLMMEGYGY